ncbi:class I SAM-dependent methyltransferase [Nocardia sp. NPDC088792]|uniref:class I SAM-dependent methyltransferase n=1 Tax=Nocardia sp. NPDC088792 TaxID=3364332 RepID=UPI00380815FE
MSELSYPFVVNHGSAGLTVTSLQDREAVRNRTAPDDLVALCRSFYDQVSRTLDSSELGEVLFFLDYGYVEVDGNNESRYEIAENVPYREAVRLAYELLGSTVIRGRTVLDIGCGRGGLCRVLSSEFDARVTGVDLSPVAIEFCRARHGAQPNTTFLVGDAGHLPLADNTFDVVTNLESSHCYADMAQFLHEVRRILRPGGTFLHADLLEPGSWQEMRTEMSKLGLIVTSDRDITANIVAARDRAAVLEAQAPRERTQLMKNFLGLPGSLTYRLLRDGALQYRLSRAVAG